MVYWEQFPALTQITGLAHGFSLRQPEVDVVTDRETALQRLQPAFSHLKAELGFSASTVYGCEQIHGAEIAKVSLETQSRSFAGVDGLSTLERGCALEILVADCCAVYLVDPKSGALALLHSGKKGTELGITEKAIAALQQQGVEAKNLVAQLSPCIAPPYYETDFAAQIVESLRCSGVPQEQIFLPVANTAAQVDKYYSYRQEKGKTGRMMALLGWRDSGK